MAKGKNREKDNSKSGNKPEEASTKSQDVSEENKDSNIDMGDIQKVHKPPIGLQAPANSSKDVAQKKGENKDNKSEGVIHVTMQSVKKVAGNERERTTSKDSGNANCDNRAAGTSTKSRTRRSGKSTLDASVSKSLPSGASNKDTGVWSGTGNKDLNKKSLQRGNQRIAVIESDPAKSKLDTYKNYKAGIKNRTLLDRQKRNIMNRTGTNESILPPFANNSGPRGSGASKTESSFRPVIFKKNRATQIDPVAPPRKISKSTEGKNSPTVNSAPDSSVATKPTESTLLHPFEETNLRNASEHTDTLQNKISSCSSLDSPEKNLHNIAEDFLNKVKILNKNFYEEFLKSLIKD